MSDTNHRYSVFETALGFCAIAWNRADISCFRLPTASAPAAQRLILRRLPLAQPGEPPAPIRQAIDAAQRYFEGAKEDFASLPIDLGEQDDFSRDVYGFVRRLGFGETTTYGAVAKALGASPEAARDVGQAMAKNPVPLIIPCHRVLAAGGKIGGFSAPGGSTAKARMLELEGVSLTAPASAQQEFGF